MKLTGIKVSEFINTLSSDAPAPGGGSASALAGAIGIALTEMVCALTLGKKKYAEHESIISLTSERASKIKKELEINIDKDTEAYNAVNSVFSMPKDTDEQKAERSAAMQEALKAATIIPFEVMKLCLEALETTQKAVGKSNTNAVSDLGVAALMLGAAVKGAGLNVLININGIKDEAFAEKYKSEMKDILTTSEKLSAEIYSSAIELI